ncbi:hypothetical protein RCO48_25445 [Peribacillus frigoritolerans]|nr:hypothetical protein [Peribacillus frigoritolerans]
MLKAIIKVTAIAQMPKYDENVEALSITVNTKRTFSEESAFDNSDEKDLHGNR